MKQLSLFVFVVSLVSLVPVSAIPPEASSLQFENPTIYPSLTNDRPPSAFDIIANIGESESAIKFSLEINDGLISQDAAIQNPNERTGETQSSPRLFMTKGSVWIQERAGKKWEDAGWARFAVSQGIEGVLFDGTFTFFHSQYQVQLEDGNRSQRMIAHKHESDFTGGNHTTCVTAHHEYLDKRQLGWNAWGDNLEESIGDTYGCPETRRVANIGIVTDCTYTASFNSTESARRSILNMVNTASVVSDDQRQVIINPRRN